MERYEINKFIEVYQKNLYDMEKAIGTDNVHEEINLLDQKMQTPDFWLDQREAQKIISRINYLKNNLNQIKS